MRYVVLALMPILLLFWWRWSKRSLNVSITAANRILESAKGKRIQLNDSETGEQLGEVDPRTFQEMVLLYARETGDVSSFYILKEALSLLKPNDLLSSETIQTMVALVGERDDIDVVWRFEQST